MNEGNLVAPSGKCSSINAESFFEGDKICEDEDEGEHNTETPLRQKFFILYSLLFIIRLCTFLHLEKFCNCPSAPLTISAHCYHCYPD